MNIDYIDSPLGSIEIRASASGITHILFVNAEQMKPTFPSVLTQHAAEQLSAYFNGTLQQFDLPLSANGSEFQQKVWQQLCSVAYGKTCSYAAIASAINNHKAVRAVGAANGRNPLSIVVPCHRVIGANGFLTGYAGGLERKAWLLAHEQTHHLNSAS